MDCRLQIHLNTARNQLSNELVFNCGKPGLSYGLGFIRVYVAYVQLEVLKVQLKKTKHEAHISKHLATFRNNHCLSSNIKFDLTQAEACYEKELQKGDRQVTSLRSGRRLRGDWGI